MTWISIICIVTLPILIYFIIDYRGPKRIHLKDDIAFNMHCLRARELIVQEYDEFGNLWASRGLILYRLNKGDSKFRRVAYVPTGFNLFWLYHFTLFRRFANKPECLEVSINSEGVINAMSAGYIWHKAVNRVKFKRTIKLRHFGFGKGRGIFSNGILTASNGTIYFGEYFRNSKRTDVHIYESKDEGLSWESAYTFEAGKIRHIHAIQEDPFTGRLWICTGDEDHESMIAWTDDGFKNLHKIGGGSQKWRSTQLVFKKDAIYWGADTGSKNLAGVYRWDRIRMELTRIYRSEGGILFAVNLSDKKIVFSSEREGFANETDKRTKLFVLDNEDRIVEIECGTWKHWKKDFRYSFAMLRFPRTQRGNLLATSIINQAEFAAGELLLIDENNLSYPERIQN